MPSPFPGIDPYLEAQGLWPDFHAGFLVYCRDMLNSALPDSYAAQIEEKVYLDPNEEVREIWIEVLRLPELSRVAVLELLSPANKIGIGRQEYLNKRVALFYQPVHLVGLDFLLGGHRLPMSKPLPEGNAYVIISRAERRPDAEVYAWSLRDGLPTIPIPLTAPDPDVPLDLAPAFSLAYERGRYARILRYAEPFASPLDPEERAWAEERARTATRP